MPRNFFPKQHKKDVTILNWYTGKFPDTDVSVPVPVLLYRYTGTVPGTGIWYRYTGRYGIL
jgi:hypothetical protein